MRIAFEWEWEIGDFFRGVKQKYLETVCHFKGHIWEKYKEEKPTNSLMSYYSRWFLAETFWDGDQKHTHTCKRCGEWKTKIIKHYPKTVKWTRFKKK